MAIIGTFTANGDIFTGTLKTLTLNAKVSFKPAEKETDTAGEYNLIWSR